MSTQNKRKTKIRNTDQAGDKSGEYDTRGRNENLVRGRQIALIVFTLQ